MTTSKPLIWLLLAGVSSAIATTGSGCTIDRRSSGFRCVNPVDCADGRVCEQGWCIVTAGDAGVELGDAGAAPDGGAMNPPPDAAIECDPVCDSCRDDGTCVITCAGSASCRDVVCPAGVPCEVRCTGTGNCSGGVDCQQASSCDVVCEGINTCAFGVRCGSGPCKVGCIGTGSCNNSGVDCQQASDCDVVCEGINACADGVLCGPGPCAVQCQGVMACQRGVDCANSCACDTLCENDACSDDHICPDLECEDGGECTSEGNALCNQC